MQKDKPFRGLGALARKDISKLFQTANRVYADSYIDIRQASGQQNSGRVLVVASRKVGTAPKRNKLKRQIKHIFFENEILWRSPHDWIIILKPHHRGALSYVALRELLLRRMTKTKSEN